MQPELWIQKLRLEKHPEGGWYREVYRSPSLIPAAGLSGKFDGPRTFCTSIYYLLSGDQFSAFHRIRQDELWHFYAGNRLAVHVIDQDGNYSEKLLGREPELGESFQQVVAAGDFFGATLPAGGYALVGCTVAPGFEFADFEMPSRAVLLEKFPQHRDLIIRLTR